MSRKKLRQWKTLSRKTILDHSKFLKIESHEIELPDGEIISDWPWVILHDAALILAQREDGEFLVFRQRKYAIDGISLAPVGGMLEPNEYPLEAAKRELLEETGYKSEKWVDFGSYLVDPNSNVGTMHLFLALDAKYVTEPNSDDLEDQDLLFLNQSELEKALEAGEFKVLAWTTVVALSLRYFENRKK